MKKRWDGKYKISECSVKYCEGQGTNYNPQRIVVCAKHKDVIIKIDYCPVCEGILEENEGKFGKFYTCFKCGNFSLKKIMEMM